MERILTFKLICPFWASFRNPNTINVHVTYRFPPLTTLYGLLNAARGWPQDHYPDRDQWRISLAVESNSILVETFSKVMKVYEDKRGKKEREEQKQTDKGFFIRTTLIRQKLLEPRYTVYLKAAEDLLTEAETALQNPYWPLYLGESDDVVDVLSVHIVDADPKPASYIHSIIPGIVEGCQLVKVPVRFRQLGKDRWSADYQIYSLPPAGDGVELGQPMLAYSVEGRNVIFNENGNHSGKTQSDIVGSYN